MKKVSDICRFYVFLFLGIVCLRCLGFAIASDIVPMETGFPLGLEPDFELPDHNPMTVEKVSLGKRLFFDKNLSKDRSISCATCHDPAKGFSNGGAFAQGVSGAISTRNVPSIVNRLFGLSQFWDGRAETLESQIRGPLFNPGEMGMDEDLLLRRLQADAVYLMLFQQVFDSEPTVDGVLKAVAAFERTLLSTSSPFDRYEWNGEKTALTDGAMRGIALFRGKARCSTCHIGTNFTDENFHNLGAGEGAGKNDPGRASITNKNEDFGKFKTPSLRNIALTAPYMHDGSLATLNDVIEFYNRGGRPNPYLDKEIKPLQLTDVEKSDLLEFLKSLTSPIVSISVEELKAIIE